MIEISCGRCGRKHYAGEERLRHGTAGAGQGGTEIAVISRVAIELTSNHCA